MPLRPSSAAQLAKRPAIKPGDTVRVHVKVREGDKERIQVFEGMVIGMHRGGARATFTVRKVSFGQGVERIFPLHSPIIDKIDVVRTAKVRRAKLYFLRELKGKAARMKDAGRSRRPSTSRAQAEPQCVKVRAFRTLENALRRLGFVHVAGVDEVGRGCLAGPVVAAAVVLDPNRYIPRICDSKTVTALERDAPLRHGSRARRSPGRVAGAEPAEIDTINIHQASLRAMQRAVSRARAAARLRARRRLPHSRSADGAAAVIHGDARCTAIAAASIVAKVTRDRMMLDLHAQDPRYGFDRHKGYATRDHLDAVRGSATRRCIAVRSGRRRCLIGWTCNPLSLTAPDDRWRLIAKTR